MPTIKRFATCRIELRFRDHLPPHVHVLTGDGRDAMVIIHAPSIVGPVKRHEIREALAWIVANEENVFTQWKELHP